jgi:hypothetical protein
MRSSHFSIGRQPLPTQRMQIGPLQQWHHAPIPSSVARLNGGLSTTFEQWRHVNVSTSVGRAKAGSVMIE